MKFTTCTADLDHALRAIAPAIGVRSSHPILDCCLIQANADGTAVVTGFNLDLGITCTIPATVTTAGAVALPYRLLAGLVSRLEGDEAVTLADGALSASSGSYSLAAQSAEDYPALPAVEAAETQLELAGAVRACMVAVSTDAAKQMLTGIHLGDGHLSATDGHRLMRCAVDLPDGLAMTLPATTMKLLADHSCSVVAAKGQAVITTDEGIRVYSRVLDGTYPNVAQLIPASFEHTMIFNRHRLTRALERVAIIAEATNGVVKLTAADGKLTITAEADANNGRESLAYDGTGNGMWAFNVAYLLDGLKAFRSAESVELNCNAATTPVVLRPAGDDGRTYLVMPVQVRS
jgi:DNA polymerase-3 subunit beta